MILAHPCSISTTLSRVDRDVVRSVIFTGSMKTSETGQLPLLHGKVLFGAAKHCWSFASWFLLEFSLPWFVIGLECTQQELAGPRYWVRGYAGGDHWVKFQRQVWIKL